MKEGGKLRSKYGRDEGSDGGRKRGWMIEVNK